jgi:hypothetical protein
MFRGAVAFTWEPHFSGLRAHNPTTPQRHPSNTPPTASQTATARPHHQCARIRPFHKGGAHRVSTEAPDGDILLCRCRHSQHGLRCISSPGCPQACTVLGLPCGLLPMVPHTVETFGCQGKPLLELITDVSSWAATQANGTFTREQLLTGNSPSACRGTMRASSVQLLSALPASWGIENSCQEPYGLTRSLTELDKGFGDKWVEYQLI